MTRHALITLCLLTSACVPWTTRPIATQAEPSSISPAAYVESLWASKLVPRILNDSVDARTLLNTLAASPENHGRREGEGPAYFLVKGRGVVLRVDSTSRNGLALVDIAPLDGRPDLSIQIGPVLRGSSLRDATGLIKFSDFVNQLQFADAGNELNDRVLRTVLANLDRTTLPGKTVSFAGTLAAEGQGEPPLRGLVPVQLTVEGTR
ncbi:MAG: DUF2291 family protein [Bryobacteraceae bacterium]